MTIAQTQNWGGVWIDHFKAILVLPRGDDCEVSTIYSEVASKHRGTGGSAKSHPYMHETGPYSAQHFEGQQKHRRHAFYQEVGEALEGVSALLVLGSGPAPREFTEQFCADPAHHGVQVTTRKAEEMTVRELEKTIFEHFGYRHPRYWPSMPGQPCHDLNL